MVFFMTFKAHTWMRSPSPDSWLTIPPSISLYVSALPHSRSPLPSSLCSFNSSQTSLFLAHIFHFPPRITVFTSKGRLGSQFKWLVFSFTCSPEPRNLIFSFKMSSLELCRAKIFVWDMFCVILSFSFLFLPKSKWLLFSPGYPWIF